jgi:cold shock CspA family protein
MQGKIKAIVATNGFGFIAPADASGDGRGDHFFHCSAVLDFVFDEKLRGQRCEFDSNQDDRGRLFATNVRPVR